MKRHVIYAALGLMFIMTSATVIDISIEKSNTITQVEPFDTVDNDKKEINKFDSPVYRRINGFKK